LAKAGVIVSRETARIDERALEQKLIANPPAALALKLAQAKAEEVSCRFQDALVIGCDQILSCEGKIFHKVNNLVEARQRLHFLSAKTHYLHTAIALYKGKEFLWQHEECAALTMRSLTDRFIDTYLQQAGSGILSTAGVGHVEGLGIRLLEKMEGDYHAIIGLPLLPLLNFLTTKGVLDE